MKIAPELNTAPTSQLKFCEDLEYMLEVFSKYSDNNCLFTPLQHQAISKIAMSIREQEENLAETEPHDDGHEHRSRGGRKMDAKGSMIDGQMMDGSRLR